MDESEPVSGATRRLSPPLLLGMLLVPILFVWLFLRRGYPPSLRVAAFAYTGIFLAVGLLGSLGGR